VPEEERRVARVRSVDQPQRARQQILLDGLHPLAGQRPGVDDRLLSDATEARVLGVVVDVAGLTVEHPAWSEQFLEDRAVLGVVGLLGFLLGVEVIEVAVELVKPMDCREELVAVTQVVLPIWAVR
jgi:xanthosine utilization system XapX-like protein